MGDTSLRALEDEATRALSQLDPERLSTSVTLRGQVDDARGAYLRAAERAKLLEGKLLELRARDARVPLELRNRLRESQATSREVESLASGRVAQMEAAGGLYVRDWIDGQGSHLELSIAAARELAVRAEEQTQQLDPAAAKRGARRDVPGQQLREIPGDAAVLEQRQRAAEARERADCHVTREEVPGGWQRELSGIVGARGARVLRSRIEPLVEWLKYQDPEWVLRRSAELGPPRLGPLRVAAVHAARRETRSEELRRERDSLRLAEHDSAWGDLARSEVAEIGRLERALRAHQDTLDQLGGAQGVLLALAYEDAASFHRVRSEAEQIRLAQLAPREEMVRLIGSRPRRDEDPELRRLWEKIVASGERARIQALSDQERGLPGHPRVPVGQAQRDALIDQLREQRGMGKLERPAPEVAEALELGPGA